jgi:hypothetical protein
MASQLNPAWQRKSASSTHLAKISARFLSDTPETKKTDDLCQVIPFLLESAGQEWILRDLSKVLTQRGHRSGICQLDDVAQGVGNATQSGYCLLPLASPGSLEVHELDHVVLPVSANLEAVRTAYQHIKLLSEHKAPEIGVVIVGPRDQHSAWRYFRKLAVGSLRYLDVPLLNLGFLPEQVTPEHGPADHHRQNFLARISERLLRTGFYSSCATQNQAREEV